ncbi:MAG: transcriptional repressor [Oscillospiraceae bacterium]
MSRFSKQREVILQTVKNSKEHPTAEVIYATLKPLYPELSLGTVYRNLNVLASNGDILRLQTDVPSACFDGRLDDHLHMVCDICNKVVDVECDVKNLTAKCLNIPTPHKILEAKISLRGICENCIKTPQQTTMN